MQTQYTQHGIISDNAVLEDRSVHLKSGIFLPDEFYHPPERLGNMEIWYADVYDPVNHSVFIIQFTYGPDPLKKEAVLFVSFHAYTPDQGVTSLTRQISFEQLMIYEEPYSVSFGKNTIRTYKTPDLLKTGYHIQLDLEHIFLDINIEPVVQPWLPFGEKISFFDRERKGTFSWIPSIPEGRVNGSVTIGHQTAMITDAHGYYDHTYWETGTRQPFHRDPLFWDDILVSWSWLKIIHADLKIAMNEFCFRPWLKKNTISSLMVCKGDSIILSYNHESQIRKVRSAPDLPHIKAGEFSLSFSFNDVDLNLDVTPTVLLRYQEMLEYTHPIARPLVRMFFGNPVAFYTLARVNVHMRFGTEQIDITDAFALYEPMVLTARPSLLEDRIRKFIARRIRRRI